jgi:hypothetical protein
LKRSGGQRLGEDVGKLVFCIDPEDFDITAGYVGAKVVVFQTNVFSARTKFWGVG